ncbi:MAG TPA: NAD(P)-dependent oxidoreductase [Oligoflexus sp.]|uniref:NAD(P)-dependent oxidoreductase n=1 Tax=Oligoflexus sp. TaxID=1971216 RepID=UPI002D5DD60C|nr:NAD(P)-dependent oxidoreductase [Oligoflexus sp.]HYX39467.1 NAD(P)-dependent oxidoreductase [Oligoflexus sp.]
MIVVTASSFLKVPQLRRRLEAAFPYRKIIYVEDKRADSRDKLMQVLQEAEAWLVGRELADAALLSALPSLRVVAKYGVGLDNVDVEACSRLGIRIAWEGGVNRDAVGEHTLGLMLAMCRNIGLGSRLLSQGIWWKNGGRNLGSMTVGIVGFGHIGTRVAELLQPFGCQILIHDILDKTEEAEKVGAKQVKYQELLKVADLLTFHVPLTPQTLKMFGANELALIKPAVYIVNTSRGEVLDQEKVKEALQKGELAGVGLDVYQSEPLVDKDLYSQENFVGTAHTAGNSQEAVLAMGEAAIRGLQKELALLAKNSDLN